MSPHNVSKANALLDSVLDSIQGPRSKTSSALSESRTDADVVANSSTDPETSSATRRKNALAQALFGASDSDQSLTSLSPPPTDEPNTGSGLPAERPLLIESSASTSARSLRDTLSPSYRSVNAGVLTSSSSATEPPNKQQELAKEVQRRAEAAMADLNRMPSNAASQRRRVEPGQISGPRLVSASTSVDTIPVRSESAASGQLPVVQNQSPTSTKFGTRFKKLRGSLRASKQNFPASDGSQHIADLSSSYGDRALAATPDIPSPFGAAELSRPKLAVATPQAPVGTTGPGLKGFVSRFLKPRSGETPEPDRRKQWPSSSASASVSVSSYFAQQQAERQLEMGVSQQITQSAPPVNKSFRPDTPVSPESSPLHKQPPSAPPVPSSVPDASAARTVDESALKQFIDAANNLGLDQDALTELLSRSNTIGSRLTTRSSKHVSTTSRVPDRGQGRSEPPASEPAPASAAGSTTQRSLVQTAPRPSGEIVERAPIRRPLAHDGTTAESANSTIVRRTLIFPSEARQPTPEPGASLRKSSSTRRRRSTSAASMHSNRPLHDRVPTPPPPKSSTGRRFSAEQSPPMPHIPNSLLAQTEAINAPQSAPAVPLEKSNSAYDSL